MNDDAKRTIIKTWLGTGAINVFGVPFAGKDTQGQKLADLLDAPLLGGGDILRNSVIPEAIKAELAQGNLIPTDDYMRIVLPYLSQTKYAGSPLILSSVGRWQGEEQGVLQATAAAGHEIKAVIYLRLDAEQVVARWRAAKELADRSERSDDASEEVLAKRLDEFATKTLPVIDEYRRRDLLIEIDGSGSIDEIFTTIVDCLVERAKTT